MIDTEESSNLLVAQRSVCEKYALREVAPDEMVAVAISTIGAMPIYGTRIDLPEGGNVSWFYHCGADSSENDFYKPLHVERLAFELVRLICAVDHRRDPLRHGHR